MTRFTNWIAGRSTPSKAGLSDLTSRLDGGQLGQWPRSGAGGVEAALAGLVVELAPVGIATLELAWDRLLELSERATRAPQDSNETESAYPSGIELLHERLGQPRDRLTGFLGSGYLSTFGFGARDFDSPGAVTVVCHWSDSVAVVFRQVAECLFHGRAVLLLPDPNLPMTAAAVAQAFLDIGLEPQAIAVLHGLDNEGWLALASAFGSAEPTALHCTGRLAVDQRQDLAPFAATRPNLVNMLACIASPQETEWQAPSNLASPSCTDANVRQAAMALAQDAFGAQGGFGGLAHGAPLVARIHRSVFSSFTEYLVAELDAMTAAKLPPLGFPSSGKTAQATRYRDQWKAGLDAGATLITGGTWDSVTGDGVHFHPALLVNLEADSGLFALGEPLGVLRLHRA